MKRDIRMIGLDLDGTLLNDKKEITPYTRDVLKAAIEQGVHVLIATGRPFSAIDAELAVFPEMRYAVTSNGARIVDVKNNQTLFESTMSGAKAVEVLDKIQEYDMVCEIFTEGDGYSSIPNLERIGEFFDTPEMIDYVRRTRVPIDDVRQVALREGVSIEKVHLIFNDLDARKKVKEIISQIEGVTVTGAFPNTIETLNAGTSKAEGLLKLGHILGIEREQIMVCGDGMNDYEMIEKSGFGVAMANGNPKVKAIADYVTVSNNEDGVAKAIEKFVLK